MNLFKLFSEKQRRDRGDGESKKEKEGRWDGNDGRREERRVFCHISILLCVSKGWVRRRLGEAPGLEGYRFQQTC